MSYLRRFSFAGLATLSGVALLAGLGCPEKSSAPESNTERALPCAEVGQRCQVSPGKLGSCVLIDGCGRDNCYVCQSQH